MTIRTALLATTMLMLPLVAEAQAPQQPVWQLPRCARGFNIKTSENIDHVITNLPGAAGFTTPNANIGTSLGGAGVGSLGYGLGNGLRVEIEGDYRGNSLSNAHGKDRTGSGYPHRPAEVTRYGPMVNVDYDFVNLIPDVVRDVGIGLGYQWAHLANFTTSSAGPGCGAIANTLKPIHQVGLRCRALWAPRMTLRRCRVWRLWSFTGLWRCRNVHLQCGLYHQHARGCYC